MAGGGAAAGPVEHELSAGGVVVREGPGGPQCLVVVPTRRDAAGRRVLTLPKGHPERGESYEQAVWLELGRAGEQLSYAGEREMVALELSLRHAGR